MEELMKDANMKRLLLIILALLSLTCTSVASVVPVDAANRKQMYSGLLHSGKPDLDALYGIWDLQFVSPVNRAYLTGVWPNFATEMPPAAWYDALAANYTNPHNMLILDMEQPALFPSGNHVDRLATAAKLVTMHNEMKTRRPDLSIGFYQFPHYGGRFDDISGVTAASLPGGANYIAWQAANADFAALWAVVDFVAPAMYYPYDSVTAPAAPISQPYIHYFFTAIVTETKRCRTLYGHNQPIIPYVWFAHAPLNPGLDIDQIVWEDMIRTAWLEADGMILWGGQEAGVTQPWNENKMWWRQFKEKVPVR
jgi:hypothetical protein